MIGQWPYNKQTHDSNKLRSECCLILELVHSLRVDYTSMNISHAVLVYDRQLVTYTNHPIHSSYKPLREAIFVFVKVRYTVHYFFSDYVRARYFAVR